MGYSAIPLNTNALKQPVLQNAHGFTVGELLTFDGTDFIYAQADTELKAELVGMVSDISDANYFYLSQMGFISDIPATSFDPAVAPTPGVIYYLSPTAAGKLTATKPTTVGQVELPCFLAYTTTSGFFFSSVGTLIESGSLFNYSVVAVNTAMGVNQGYIVNGGASIDLLLPAASSVGDRIEIATLGTNGCVITQGAGQSLNIVDDTSTVGAGGTTTLQVTNGVLSGSLILICETANTVWKAISGTGVWNPA